MPLLSEFIKLKRRYHRSVNLERDLSDVESLAGYVVTPRSAESLHQILTAVASPKLSRSWTLTGAYGTGKSSFAHFLLSLLGESADPSRKFAQKILNAQSPELSRLAKKINLDGYVRAVATAQREPISHTVVKALLRGAEEFGAEKRGRKLKVLAELTTFVDQLKAGKECDHRKVVEFAAELARTAKSGLIILIDELGKGLEYAASRQADGDLYLLQQLAEMKSEHGVYVIGLLHQSFADYAQSLSTVQRSEWQKIQGRFADIPFTNSAAEAIRLISHAIESKPETHLQSLTRSFGQNWHKELASILPESSYSPEMISDILPLHPVASIALPLMCNRFAQNDRSLFTFLTSDEPYSFSHFLGTHEFSENFLPTLKLASLYDYFVDVVGANIYSRPHLSRWLEIQGRISEATGLEVDELKVLKAIGILNLIATVGSLRASKTLVAMSMCDTPNDEVEIKRWEKVIQSLVDRRIVAHRQQLDELRVWEGSDFNIEQSIQLRIQSNRRSLDEILNDCAKLGPIVAQRHSFKTGTFRFFERRYVSNQGQLNGLQSQASGSDGVIAYWLNQEKCKSAPQSTIDGKPLIVVSGINVESLQNAANELFALQKIAIEAAELQTDGVARREVRQRTLIARRCLDVVFSESFDFRNSQSCISFGESEKFTSWRSFVGSLSDICDQVYDHTPTIVNELINRRELTSQGARARRELLNAMIKDNDKPDLGLVGFGPEVSMYRSVLAGTGIHRIGDDDTWEIGAPTEPSVVAAWNATEQYCLESIDHARSVDKLFKTLESSPFGMKAGILPVLFAAVLIAHDDDICIYKDGTFIPVLGPEHFELLVKDAKRFSVKHFVTTGLRAQIFKEIEELVTRSNKRRNTTRNSTLLGVVTPLIAFVKGLPAYTKKTANLPDEAKAVRDLIDSAKEPDELLFTLMPQALGLSPIVAGDKENIHKAKELRIKLLKVLRELQTAYENMLEECSGYLSVAFNVKEESLRESLRDRALCLSVGSRGLFDALIKHLVDDSVDDRAWLTTVLMIVGDREPNSWRDEDLDLFRSKIGDYAKGFANFEALQSSMQHRPGGTYEPKRITLTQPSGKEEQKILWIDSAKEQTVNRLVDEIINEKLAGMSELRDMVLSKLTERLLADTGDMNRRREA